MSLHKSLKKMNALKRHRNVLTRSERLTTMTAEGKATDATSVFGLPKYRSIMVKAKPKAKAEVAAVPGAVPVEGAAPAAGAAAAPAKGAAAPAAGKAAAPAAGKAAAPAAAAKPPAKK